MSHTDKKILEGNYSDLPDSLQHYHHTGDNTLNGVNFTETHKHPELCKQLLSNLPKTAIARDFRDLEEGEK